MAKPQNIEFLEIVCHPTVKERSYDALLTWLFGSDERTIAVCAKSAYENVKKRFREIGKMPEQDKRAYRDDVNGLIARCLDELFKLELSEREAFDAWHKETCENICEVSDKHNIPKWVTWMENGFTYGLAQNWLNVTIKNMLIMEQWDEQLEPIRNYLHIPADGFIIEAATKNLGIKIKDKPWYRWDYNDYIVFQEEVCGVVDCPISWEYSAWSKNQTGI